MKFIVPILIGIILTMMVALLSSGDTKEKQRRGKERRRTPVIVEDVVDEKLYLELVAVARRTSKVRWMQLDAEVAIIEGYARIRAAQIMTRSNKAKKKEQEANED